ncbi:16406_t:CDS:2 [Racocetra fulgida]|uniref:16406_t:CDS:1 n=1 Tax=Racocetra fulgida TaxID=60492 RepID=A0A9N8YZD0_9GLOM|nr:16406_t:CDS:2 [Racocetra fulgida]
MITISFTPNDTGDTPAGDPLWDFFYHLGAPGDPPADDPGWDFCDESEH